MAENLKDLITEAEEQLRQAMLASDIPALSELLAPDLMFTNHLGQLLDRDADLAAHRSGELSINRLEPAEQHIRVLSDGAAVVSVLVQVEGEYAGEPAGGAFRFTRVWALSASGAWLVVAAHATRLA